MDPVVHPNPLIATAGFSGQFDPAAAGGGTFDVELFESPHATTAPRKRPDGPIAGWHAESDLAIAYHGDLFNAAELRLALQLPPDAPIGQVLLAGWRRWFDDLWARLNGVLALALRDGNSLLLYRDPSALCTLYCDVGHAGRVSFATCIDALRQPDGPRRIARHSLHEYLRFLDIAAPRTLFDNVIAVEAGRRLGWSGGALQTIAVPTPREASTPPASFDDAVDRLDVLLQDSVRARLAGSQRPAAFLSGGIDSALLCAIAARQRSDLTAVTVGFAAAPFDESPVAARIAADLGIEHQVLHFQRPDHLAAFERLARGLEQPMADPATPSTVLAFDHCVGRFDAVLDGTGADEAVGMQPARHLRLAVGCGSLLPRAPRLALARAMRALPGLSGYAPLVDFEHPADPLIRWHGFTRHEIESLCGEPVSFADTQFYRTFARFPRGAHAERYSALLNAMPCDRLHQAARVSGLQPRYPYADRHVDRFIRELRTDYRWLPGEPKRILRAVLARYVPVRLWDIPKHGFDFPLADFLAAEDHRLVRRYLDPIRWGGTKWLSAERVGELARRFIAGEQRLRFRVWALVILAAWLEHQGDLH